MTPEALKALTTDAVIMGWKDAQKRLADAKALEMDMRKEVTARLFPTPKKGTQRFQLGGGWAIKLVHKITTDLFKPETFEGDNVDLVAHIAKLATATSGNEAQFIVERLFKYKVEVSASELNLLRENAATYPVQKTLLDIIMPYLVDKEGAPSLELESPDDKKKR